MNNEKQKEILSEMGKYFLDISKLIFGGIILASIMALNINKLYLFAIGSFFVVTFFFAGLQFLNWSNNKKQ